LRSDRRQYLKRLFAEQPWPLWLSVAVLAGLFYLAEALLHRCQNLPTSLFEQNSIIGAAISTSWPFIAIVLLSLIVVIKNPRFKWNSPLWWVMAGPVVFLTWHLTTTQYNFYYASYFTADRIVILALGISCFFHPGFIGAFLASAYVYFAQFNLPLQFSWTDKLVLLHALLALFVWVGFRSFFSKLLDQRAAPVLIFAIIGAFYLLPALGKIQIGWLQTTDLSYLLESAYHQNGWLSHLTPERFESLASATHSLNPVLLFVSLVAEISVLALLLNRKLTLAILGSLIALHVGIFVSSGIFFWKCIVLDLAVAIFALRLKDESLFNRQTWLVCVVAMTCLAAASPRVVLLAWYDSPLTYRFRFEAIGESGDRYELIADDFAPYDLQFAQARFYFTTQQRQLVDTFGTTKNAQILDALTLESASENIDEIRNRFGALRYSEFQRGQFERFLIQYMKNSKPPASFHPPHHIWTNQLQTATLPRYSHNEEIQQIDVYLVERLSGVTIFEQLVQSITR
jgi:hypothetical protein